MVMLEAVAIEAPAAPGIQLARIAEPATFEAVRAPNRALRRNGAIEAGAVDAAFIHAAGRGKVVGGDEPNFHLRVALISG